MSYVVLSFGGLLGIGDDRHPLPWQALKYDTTSAATHRHHAGPTPRCAQYADESSWNWSDPATTRSVNTYYGVEPARHFGGWLPTAKLALLPDRWGTHRRTPDARLDRGGHLCI